MIINDTIQEVKPDNANRFEYSIQNLGENDIKVTHDPSGTFADDFGLMLGPCHGYTFDKKAAERPLYAITDTGLTSRLLIFDHGDF